MTVLRSTHQLHLADDVVTLSEYTLDTSAFARAEAPDGLLVHVTAAEDDASIIADVECGHVPPYLPIVNGARGRVVHTATRSALTQTLD